MTQGFPIRPVVSNISAASYHLANLARNLYSLGESTYTFKSNFNFMGKIKNEQIPLGFTIVSLFLNRHLCLC